MYGPYDNYGGWGLSHMTGWFGGGVMMIAFWVLIVFLVVWVVREVSDRKGNSTLRALDILKERYAKGEINKEEFEAKKKDLLSA